MYGMVFIENFTPRQWSVMVCMEGYVMQCVMSDFMCDMWFYMWYDVWCDLLCDVWYMMLHMWCVMSNGVCCMIRTWKWCNVWYNVMFEMWHVVWCVFYPEPVYRVMRYILMEYPHSLRTIWVTVQNTDKKIWSVIYIGEIGIVVETIKFFFLFNQRCKMTQQIIAVLPYWYNFLQFYDGAHFKTLCFSLTK